MAQAKSIYGYAQDLPTDLVTGCVQSDYPCQQTFYLKQQNEILSGQKENAQLKTEVQSLRQELEQIKTTRQTVSEQPKENPLTANVFNTSAPSLMVGLVIGAVVALVVTKKFFPKV